MIGELSRPLAACAVVAAMLAGCNESVPPKAASPDDPTVQSQVQVQETTAPSPSTTTAAPSVTAPAPSTTSPGRSATPKLLAQRCTNASELRHWTLNGSLVRP